MGRFNSSISMLSKQWFFMMSGLLLLLIAPLVSSLPFSQYFNSYPPKASVQSFSYSGVPIAYNQGQKTSSYSDFGLTRSFSASSDIVAMTRTQANSLKTTLRSLASNPDSSEIVNRVIYDINNVCLNNIDEAIDAIESSTKLIENAGPEIKKLIKTVKAFQRLTDTPAVVKEAANILRLLDTLIPKLAPSNPQVCGASNEEAFGSLRSLAVLVDELASSTKITTLKSRKELKDSAKIISGVTTFLTKLNKSFTKFDKFCTSDKEYNIEAITAIGEMMTDLGDLFAVLGGITDAEEIRKQGDFTKTVVANINRLGNLDLGTLECNKAGNFQAAAETLDDLAKLIEDVGLENLCNQLDLDIDCGLGLTRNVGFARSSDIVQETRAQANSLKNTLRSLSSIPGATKIVNRVINDIDNVCLNNIEEAVEAIDTGATIVENAGPEIKQLIKTVEAFQKLTDTPSVVLEAANILRLLETLIPKLAPANPKVCGASNAQAFGSLRGLAVLVDELSSNTKITGLQTRQELKTTAKTISGVTTFLTKLNKAFTKFDKFCTSDKEYNVEAIIAIGEMMTDLADLFAILGGISDAEEIRKQGDFTNKVVANINKLGNLDLGTLECNKAGSFQVAAETLNDLAKLIDDVGIESLCNQLDLDLDCTFKR